MFPSPTRMFLTKGVGVHRHALTAFEFALRDADIEQQNLVYVSSILPPRCEVIAREVGIESLKPGDITFCVLARSETNEFGRHVLSGHAVNAGSLSAEPNCGRLVSKVSSASTTGCGAAAACAARI